MTVEIPDAEALAIHGLLTMPEVTDSALGERIYSVVPKQRTFPLARVSRIGGDPMWNGDPYWAEQAACQVDVWADGGTVEARGLAELLRAASTRLPGVWPTGVISSVKVSGLVNSADSTYDPPKPRYRYTLQLVVHPSRGAPGLEHHPAGSPSPVSTRQEVPAMETDIQMSS
jgi:hypothetical protein